MLQIFFLTVAIAQMILSPPFISAPRRPMRMVTSMFDRQPCNHGSSKQVKHQQVVKPGLFMAKLPQPVKDFFKSGPEKSYEKMHDFMQINDEGQYNEQILDLVKEIVDKNYIADFDRLQYESPSPVNLYQLTQMAIDEIDRCKKDILNSSPDENYQARSDGRCVATYVLFLFRMNLKTSQDLQDKLSNALYENMDNPLFFRELYARFQEHIRINGFNKEFSNRRVERLFINCLSCYGYMYLNALYRNRLDSLAEQVRIQTNDVVKLHDYGAGFSEGNRYFWASEMLIGQSPIEIPFICKNDDGSAKYVSIY